MRGLRTRIESELRSPESFLTITGPSVSRSLVSEFDGVHVHLATDLMALFAPQTSGLCE